MKFLSSIFEKIKKSGEKKPRRIDYRQELSIRHGREQFKELLKKGLSVPVTLL